MSKKIKQRIVGLLVLGALTAIIVPILLDISQSNQIDTVVSPIPDKPNGFIVKRLSLDLPQKSAVPDDIPKPIGPLDTSNHTETVESQMKPEPLLVESQPEPPKAVVEIKKSLEKPQAWVVQLASFSSEKNALALRNKLKQAGYRAFIERISIESNKKIRVKVGPELSKKVAISLQGDLLDEFHLKGVIVKHRGGTSVVTTGE